MPTIIGVSMATHLRIQLITFLFKVLHVRHPCYLFTLFHFASSARTRNLMVTPHRSLAMGHSFTVRACGLWNSLPHWFKNERTVWDWWERTLRDCCFLRDWIFFFWDLLSSHSLLYVFTIFCSHFWPLWAGSALIFVWCRLSAYRQIVADLM
jgi:hypothetical protein